MFGWLGKILGTEKAINRAVSGGLGMLDDAFHTDQEKTVERINMVKALQDQFAPRAVTRRVLAIIIYANTFLHLNTLLFFSEWFSVEDIIVKEVILKEVELTMIVTFFYFGYYGVKKVMGLKK